MASGSYNFEGLSGIDRVLREIREIQHQTLPVATQLEGNSKRALMDVVLTDYLNHQAMLPNTAEVKAQLFAFVMQKLSFGSHQ